LKLGKLFTSGAVLLTAGSLIASSCGSSSKTPAAAGTTAAPAAAATTAAPAAATTAAPAAATTAAPAAATTAAPAATTAAPSADPLGAKGPAPTGTPIKIGYVWSGVSASVDNSGDEVATQAMVKFLNEYQSGIAGHPISLSICATNSDTALAAKCGDQMIADNVAVVLFNVVGEIAPWATKVIEAKIPIFAYSSADASLMKGGDVFTMSNPIAGLASFPASVAKKNGFTSAVVSVINVPAAVGPAKALATPLFTAAGAKVNVLPIAPDAADHTSDVQAALKDNPQMWHIIGNPAYCSLDIKALRTAGYKGQITMISNCLDPAAVKALGKDLEGIQVSFASGEDPADPDFQQLQAIATKYTGGKLVPQGTPVGSYLVWEAFNRVMKKATSITPADIAATIKATDGTIAVPTVKGSFIKCDGKQVPGIAIACTGGFLVGTLDATGKISAFSTP
jgi:branched-chain amino acid transport system substrate-binding protein